MFNLFILFIGFYFGGVTGLVVAVAFIFLFT